MTRREWFLHLGGGVVLTGWSAADLAGAELPQGVYGPSRDHLSHALAGHPMAAGGETELVQVPSWPTYFQPAEFRLIKQLAALLLGEAPDSPVVNEIAAWIDLSVSESAAVRKAALALAPAHRTLAMHYYGEKTVRHLEEFDAQTVCREGLVWLDLERKSNSLDAILRSISDDHPRAEHAGTRFFAYMKDQVIDGFYTSRAGLNELGRGNHNFHASPPGCKNQGQ